MLSNVLYVIRIVLLGLWVGAMAGFAFLFAPTAFAHVGPTAAFAATIGATIKALDVWGDVTVVLTIAITAFAALEPPRLKIAIGASLVIAAIFSAYDVRVIIPKMETTPLLTPAYQSLHGQSSGVYSVAFLCALLALVLSSRSAYR